MNRRVSIPFILLLTACTPLQARTGPDPAQPYRGFAALAAAEPEGSAWSIVRRTPAQGRSAFTVFAIHGGQIEPGTSELADPVAGADWNLYRFEGRDPKGDNSRLHITSSRFDEPQALELAAASDWCVSIHGFQDRQAPEHRSLCVGGASEELRNRFIAALDARRLGIRLVEVPGLLGREPGNIVNRCRKGGLQLEASRALRDAWVKDPALRASLIQAIRTSLR